MRMPNPLTLNDWDFDKFLWVVLTIQGLVLLGLGPLSHVALIRDPVGLLYLLFVPGIAILRAAKVHKVGGLKTLLFSVGLSVAVIMFTGLTMNTLLPVFGVSRPISATPLAITLAIIVVILCLLAWLRDRKFANAEHVDLKGFLSAPVLLLSLLPLMSIIGTHLVNFYDSNVILMALIAMIALVVLLAGFTRFIPEHLYPWAIFCSVLSLLFFRSLVSMYLTGYDIYEEYASAALVQSTGLWDPSNTSIINGLISINIFPAIASDMSGMSLTWIVKIVYPLVFSLVPLGMYVVFRKQVGCKVALLASFIFISSVRTYYDMVLIPRQIVATLFLILILMLLTDEETDRRFRSVLLLAFGASMVVSHYGVSVIFMFSLLVAWLAMALWRRLRARRARHDKAAYGNLVLNKEALKPTTESATVNFTFVALFSVLTLAWYMYVSKSVVLDSYVGVFKRLGTTISASSLNPEISSRFLSFATHTPLNIVLSLVNSGLNYMIELFIMVGFVLAIWKGDKTGFKMGYVAISLLPLILFFAGVQLPFLSPLLSRSQVDMGRLQYIALTFLTPFAVIGGFWLWAKTVGLFQRAGNALVTLEALAPAIVSVALVAFFLLQSGFLKAAQGQYSESIPLGQKWVREQGTPQNKIWLYNAVTPEQDVFSATWLSENRSPQEKVNATFADQQVHSLTAYGKLSNVDVSPITRKTTSMAVGDYVYLQYGNVVDRLATEFVPPFATSYFSMNEFSQILTNKSKIYSNGGSEVLQ